MASTTALAQAATTAPPPFNGLFYATAATIIPVLFLAIAVQGNAYETLLKAMAAIGHRSTGADRSSNVAGLAGTGLLLITTAILYFGVLSEILAVYALYQQQASTGQTILIGVIILVFAATIGPALTFVRYWREFTNPELESDKADPS